jgi:hypothetical protein
MSNAIVARADYGIDAPKVVRNLYVGAGIGLAVWGMTAAGIWSGRLIIPLGDAVINF